MTDFYISAISKDFTNTHIQRVRLHRAGSINTAFVADRAFIASLINLGKTTFKTMVEKPAKDGWTEGASVHVIDKEYLTTDANKVTRDNLGNLPTF
jgi:hypothetical protein